MFRASGRGKARFGRCVLMELGEVRSGGVGQAGMVLDWYRTEGQVRYVAVR